MKKSAFNKHVFKSIWLLLPALMQLSCNEDDAAQQKQNIQFTFDLKQLADEGGRVHF
jgi:hypothetical protein